MMTSLSSKLPAVVVAAAVTLGFADHAQAQWSFSFGYSEGYRGHHHYHHHGHWHGHYGWWYAPRYDYVYVPPPTVYVAPVVTPLVPAQPAISTATPTAAPVAAAGTASNSVATASPTVRNNSLPAYSGQGVTIRNPAGSGGVVAFVVDERLQLELSPGETAPLKEKGSYTVTFDRGGDFGTTHRVLGEGTYEFVAGDKGWELRSDSLDGAARPNLPTVRRNELPAAVR